LLARSLSAGESKLACRGTPSRTCLKSRKRARACLQGQIRNLLSPIPVAGLDWLIVASAGQVLKTPLRGAGKPNPYCSEFKPGENNAEDPQSVGSLITFGKFRTIHLGDLTKNKEFELMCPNNPIGTVDLLLGLHHGQATSNSVVAVHALRPRVAIMNDGNRKGGEPETMQTVHSSPGLEDLWQMHFSLLSGQEYTTPGVFIAN
jgi:competence protein ComEC